MLMDADDGRKCVRMDASIDAAFWLTHCKNKIVSNSNVQCVEKCKGLFLNVSQSLSLNNTCVESCGSLFEDETKECVANCTNVGKFQNGKRCSSFCELLAVSWASPRHCSSECLFTEVRLETQSVCNECPSGFYLTAQYLCVSSCSKTRFEAIQLCVDDG